MSKHASRHGPFVYKEVAGVKYKVDLALPDETKFGLVAGLSQAIMRQASGKPSKGDEDHSLPLLVYFHGGGLLVGSRTAWFPHWLLTDALDAGFAFISVDYTLLVPTDGHALIADVKDLFAWIVSDLNQHIAESSGSSQLVNTNRIVACGSSAGGYLAYLAEPFMRKDGVLLPLLTSNAPFLDLINTPASSPPVVETTLDATKDPRHAFLLWLLQTGEFTDYLTGVKGLGAELAKLDKKDRGAALPAAAKALYPTVMADASFPPTFFLHGAEDALVPPGESQNVAATLERLGVPHEIVIVPGADHAFDLLPGFDPSVAKGLVPFLLKHSVVA
ncbi:hypothetical protein RQP46_006495 [Phenoliferia psychrophenolica]